MDNKKQRRLRVAINGAVQGVGFRPFVYRLATSLALRGWVINDTQGVLIEGEGDVAHLTAFLDRLSTEAVPYTHLDVYKRQHPYGKVVFQ